MRNERLRQHFQTTLIVGAVLLAGGIGSLYSLGRLPADGGSPLRTDNADEAPAVTTPTSRQLRSSLSMPYFSFARALHSRS
ncbi:hypothetical protein [Xanthomonas sp. GPE 39]|uniref:hypothetical protein n=1 Tax=Xanthomonas sp. GPE 39 TaxID=1583099 RepID=UPI0005F2F371|nr:hypothetical protein [Xanthomonas sp. GPE 39]